MDPVPAYIFAGGQSRRFGSDKALALYQGQPLVLLAAQAVREAGLEPTVIAGCAGKYAGLGLRTIADILPGLGPLGGLYTLWNDSPRAEWALVLACDLAPLRADWLRALLAARHEAASVVLFDTEPCQPLMACYHHGVASLVPRLLHGERASMHALLRQCQVMRIPAPVDWSRLHNVNRPEDLVTAAACQSGSPP
jgi:molybdopterin-guanine dinucleotide biosynthesis protein A